jgi:hypothetical protein
VRWPRLVQIGVELVSIGARLVQLRQMHFFLLTQTSPDRTKISLDKLDGLKLDNPD